MTHNEFKDRLFDILNETEALPIADIETDDNASEIKIILKDHTQFLITTAPYGNSMTTRKDITNAKEAKLFMLSLTETVGSRLRADNVKIKVVAVSICDYNFKRSSHQMTLPSSTDITNKIYNAACKLFDEFWDGTPIRQIGVHTSHAKIETCTQLTLFDDEGNYSLSAMNQAVDEIRLRYGDNAIFRACFLKSIARNMEGGQGGQKSGITEKEV